MTFSKCLINYIKKHIILCIVLLVFIILSSLSVLLPPLVLRYLVDDIIENKEINKVLTFSFIYMASSILIYLLSYIEQLILVFVSNDIQYDLRVELLKKVHRIDYLTLSNLDSGIIESHFSSDIESISLLVSDGVISLVIDSIKIISILVSIFIYSIYFGLFVLLVLPIIFIFTLIIKKKMFKTLKETKALEASVSNNTLETLDNITTIKAYRIFDRVKDKYKSIITKHYLSQTKSSNYDAFFSPVINILKYLLISLLIILSSMYGNIFTLSCGMVVSLIDLISSLFTPLESLSMEIQTIQKSTSSISRINEFFKVKESDKKTIDSIDLKDIKLCFSDVCFSYKKDEKVIDNFNLELNNCDKLIIKGRTGAGKSTLFKLSYGLIKPDSGRVTINDLDVYLFSDELKSKLFSCLSQDVFFTGGTIKEELTLLKNIDDNKIYSCLKAVGLTRINDINKEFKIDEYSLGELELINIARVMLSDTPILLLDEYNALIDLNRTKKVTELINTYAKNKMVISINHYNVGLNNTKVLQLNKINV